MALTERLALLITADPQNAVRGLQQVERAADRSLGRAENRLDTIGAGMRKFGAIALTASGVAAVGLFHAAQASEEAHRSQLLLQNTLDNMPKLAGESADSFVDLAQALQRTTAADGDAIVAAEAMLGTFRLTGQQIRDVTPLVVDYARKFGIDLTDAAIQVGKALDGQVGALKRNGVSIDETAYAADRFTAVQQALREQVGGFAEAEGATFAGSLERLKNTLGDIEEGVGVGVVQAFEELLGPVQSLSQRFADLDPRTQSAIGKFLAFGTATAGVIGGLSAVAGQLIKMRDRFTVMTDAADGSGRSLTTMGKALSGLAFIGVAAAVYEFGQSLNGVTVDVDRLAVATERGLGASIEKLGPAFESANYFGDQLAEQMLSQNVPAVERLADAMDAAGYSSEHLRDLIAQQRREDVQAQVDSSAYAAAIGEQADASDGASDAMREQAAETRALTQAIDDQMRALEGLIGSNLGYEDAVDRSQGALADFNTTVQENGAFTEEADDAARNYLSTVDAQATAAARQAENLARVNGQTFTARDSTNAYITELLRVRDTLDPSSPLRARLQGYIDQLNAVPSTVRTSVETTYTSVNRGTGGGVVAPARRAMGGPVRAGEPYIVGERRAELFVPNQDGRIVPNLDALPTAAPSGGGVVINLAVTAGIGTDGDQVGRQIVEILRREVKVNGPLPLTIAG